MIVVVCNMGGVYNAVVYTVIRRKYTAVVEPTEGQMEAPPPTRSTNINAVEWKGKKETLLDQSKRQWFRIEQRNRILIHKNISSTFAKRLYIEPCNMYK